MAFSLPVFGLELAGAGLVGFLLGYGLKKLLKLLLAVIAILTALFLIPLIWLMSVGVITVNVNRLGEVISEFGVWATGLLNTSTVASLIAILPITGTFGVGLLIGFKKA